MINLTYKITGDDNWLGKQVWFSKNNNKPMLCWGQEIINGEPIEDSSFTIQEAIERSMKEYDEWLKVSKLFDELVDNQIKEEEDKIKQYCLNMRNQKK